MLNLKECLHKVLHFDGIEFVFLRYLCGGTVAAMINFSLYSSLCLLHVHYLISNFLAVIVTWIYSFFANKFFVFQSKKGNANKEGICFFILQVILFLLSFVLLYVFVDIAGWNKYLSWILNAGINVVFNFTAMRVFIWKKR